MYSQIVPVNQQRSSKTTCRQRLFHQVPFCNEICRESCLSNSSTNAEFTSRSLIINTLLSACAQDSNHWLNSFIWHWYMLGGLSSTFIVFIESNSASIWQGMALSRISFRKSCFCSWLHPWNQWTTHWISFSVGEYDILYVSGFHLYTSSSWNIQESADDHSVVWKGGNESQICWICSNITSVFTKDIWHKAETGDKCRLGILIFQL